MPTNQVAVLSDIHIGDNSPTCWYQKPIHGPFLEAALNWIAGHASAFKEVILLGDLFDTWTYPPSVQPPSVAQIIAANPEILGGSGALARVVAAVPKVTLLLGNHDGTLTVADIETLRDEVGPVELVEPVYVLSGSTGRKTAFSHGHHWTMFNAPDPTSPWNSLPIGHFVTRAFSYMMAERLKPGQNVAELRNMGYPTGFNLEKFLESFARHPTTNVAELLLDYVAEEAGMSKEEKIILPAGQTTTINAAKDIYRKLFERWEDEEGLWTAVRAALADGDGEYLAWFAQRVAIQQSADLVVFGHTHTPVGGFLVSPVDYFNDGFECASTPDCPPKEFNFTLVGLDTARAQIMQVAKGTHQVEGAAIQAMPSPIVWPALDYSCYVRILNQGSEPLTLKTTDSTSGIWRVPPTAAIPPGGRGDGWLQDPPATAGSEGSFVYERAGNPLNFGVACPRTSDPRVSGPGEDFVAKTAGGEFGKSGEVPEKGYPLQVIYTVED